MLVKEIGRVAIRLHHLYYGGAAVMAVTPALARMHGPVPAWAAGSYLGVAAVALFVGRQVQIEGAQMRTVPVRDKASQQPI